MPERHRKGWNLVPRAEKPPFESEVRYVFERAGEPLRYRDLVARLVGHGIPRRTAIRIPDGIAAGDYPGIMRYQRGKQEVLYATDDLRHKLEEGYETSSGGLREMELAVAADVGLRKGLKKPLIRALMRILSWILRRRRAREAMKRLGFDLDPERPETIPATMLRVAELDPTKRKKVPLMRKALRARDRYYPPEDRAEVRFSREFGR